MENTKTREQSVDTDPMYDNREVVTDAEAEMEREQTADNMSEDDAPETDKSAETAGSQSAGDGALSDVERQWQDKYLRLVAEFDNYRKRTDKEKKGLIALGGEDVIKSLLGVMDDIDRALVAMSQTDDIESVRKGIELIHQKLLDTLHAKGVQEIEAQGKPFDPNLHDAVMHVENDDLPEAVAKLPVEDDKKGKIIDVVQKGYKLKDKVVRYAKVVVGE